MLVAIGCIYGLHLAGAVAVSSWIGSLLRRRGVRPLATLVSTASLAAAQLVGIWPVLRWAERLLGTGPDLLLSLGCVAANAALFAGIGLSLVAAMGRRPAAGPGETRPAAVRWDAIALASVTVFIVAAVAVAAIVASGGNPDARH